VAEPAEVGRLRAHLRSAHRLAGTGSWEADLDGPHRLRWSAEVHEITGLPLDQQPTFEDFVAMLHPDDRPLFLDARAGALRGERGAPVLRALVGGPGVAHLDR